MFTLIYKYEYHDFITFVTLLGMISKQVWITPKTAIYLPDPVLWQYNGFYFVIFLTGISKIPEDI